jgi:hypothetical protein
MKWNDPRKLADEYIADLADASDGLIQFQITEWEGLYEYALLEDGFLYRHNELLNVLDHRSYCHRPEWVDYESLLNQFNVSHRIASHQIDEVWFFGFPYAGFYESRMAGTDPFWCNAPELPNFRSAKRRFVIMGFNYERGVGEMLENFCHRAESIMFHAWRNHTSKKNLWNQFIRYDQVAPGIAEVGNVHFAPNSIKDYDWANETKILSRHHVWYKFPDLTGTPTFVDCREWGCSSDMDSSAQARAHHKWWLKHFPGRTGETYGISNNWLAMIANPNLVK